jgi:hypothetical protein
VIRPNANRSGSSKKWKAKTTKLSFGQEAGEGEDDSAAGTAKPILGKRAAENSAAKRGLATRGLPALPVRTAQDEDDRPRYSKEYLNELQSSTPNTPAAATTPGEYPEEMDLDPSELEGALIVETEAAAPSTAGTTILTEAEIRERKERRIRLAKEQNFLSLEDEDDEEESSVPKKKDDTRLRADDEELGEGFDDFVEDGGLSLGRRAEKERKKRDRQQMAELINAAEGHASDSSSDSDAERRIAYEAAQSRAGLDGLKKPRKKPDADRPQIPSKISPLPNLAECLAHLQNSLRSMEVNITAKRLRAQQLRTERAEILKREAEVQALLDETGKKYQEAMGHKQSENGAIPDPPSAASELMGQRGLESLGATPARPAPEEFTGQ